MGKFLYLQRKKVLSDQMNAKKPCKQMEKTSTKKEKKN